MPKKLLVFPLSQPLTEHVEELVFHCCGPITNSIGPFLYKGRVCGGAPNLLPTLSERTRLVEIPVCGVTSKGNAILLGIKTVSFQLAPFCPFPKYDLAASLILAMIYILDSSTSRPSPCQM